MITGRMTGERKTVSEVIEYLLGMSNSLFDTEIVSKFTMNIAAFPTGSCVSLSTNERGIVTKQNRSAPMRPIIKVLYDKDGNLLKQPYEADLLKELTIFITQSCEF